MTTLNESNLLNVESTSEKKHFYKLKIFFFVQLNLHRTEPDSTCVADFRNSK